MNVLVLGCGMQGKAVIHDLCRSDDVEKIVAVDVRLLDIESEQIFVDSSKISFLSLDVSDKAKLVNVMKGGFDVVIDMLPKAFARSVAEVAIECGIHFVSANYSTDLVGLHEVALNSGVTLMPESGMDPGIDLVLIGEVVRKFDEVHELKSYGGGLPEPSAATNPLKYKITWTFEGVLDSYVRDARILYAGKVVKIPARHIFDEDQIHTVEISRLGKLEAIPNGDAVRFAEELGIRSIVQSMGRYTLRWPGHSQLWKTWVGLGFLDDTPVPWLENKLSPRQFLSRFLEPQLQLGPGERDLVIIRIEASGVREGCHRRLVQHVIDWRDMDTGLTAMSRTVGYTASIVAQMIIEGRIEKRGLLSPIRDIPYDLFVDELAKRSITVSSVWENIE